MAVPKLTVVRVDPEDDTASPCDADLHEAARSAPVDAVHVAVVADPAVSDVHLDPPPAVHDPLLIWPFRRRDSRHHNSVDDIPAQYALVVHSFRTTPPEHQKTI